MFDEFSEDLSTLTTIDGYTYTKQDEEDELPLIERTLTSMYKEGLTCTEENCTNEEHLHIGDYVEYTPDPAGPYYPDGQEIGSKTAYTTDLGATELQVVEQETLNWRVIGYDESDDQVVIISDATKNETISFYGQTWTNDWKTQYTAVNNYKDIIETACNSLYGKEDVGTARSVTMNDLKTYFGVVYDESSYDTDPDWGYGANADNYYTYEPNIYITNPVKLEIWQNCNMFFIPEIVCDIREGSAYGDDYIRLGPDLSTVLMADSGLLFNQDSPVTHGIRPLVELDSAVTNTQVRKITN